MSIKAKLKRFESHMSTTEKEKESATTNNNEHGSWEQMNTEACSFDGMVCYIRTTRMSLQEKHGPKTFAEMKAAIDRWDTSAFAHPLSKKGIPTEKLLFFDTETTGLSSGAGTQMFLLGFASFTEKEVEVKQYLLSKPDAEVALYHFFLADAKKLDHLVTFNGKAFDWPRLKTRHSYLREAVPALPKFGHFDLLHGSRRLWKNELPSCNLSTLEAEKLGIKRTADTPSYLVPMLYFDFVREGNPAFMESVFAHHEADMLSLIALYAKLSDLILDAKGQASDAERFQIARWHEAAGQQQAAFSLYESLLDSKDFPLLARRHLGDLLKKQRRYAEAAEQFHACVREGFASYDCWTELSLIYEHYLKERDKAEIYAYRALESSTTNKEREAALKRAARISGKLKR
ncbi:ribonuclease H-like domain-containing protein [Shouchella clausii]|uniref:YprB ribonuclease H-like domain-containing protein n=1 Tax=Shouchella clausii TaxID=79880 RepID=A0A268RZY8_SHOCL|nr:ribonuclease H-like domain-containing protein [Shouchella clausii]PAD41869.1 hypothetical protein CHH54_15115 [Bacillus sp. 7520-S]AST97754.1 hypothetical protein BC8716_18040 [Shouchella clausii]MBU8595097.1 ribonuclease H-like domain-containing protein [Shouchella clausii]MCY1104554.1 ribonuclease H-like domain-containing protein [Shouchella clausii]MEB5475003.1 ribonuclease H-like domain-containing protein [Shouchella clausii]